MLKLHQRKQTAMIEHFLTELPDGSLMDYGRHAVVNGVRGTGPVRCYSGEAAEVMSLVLAHTGRPGCAVASSAGPVATRPLRAAPTTDARGHL